MIVVLVQGQKFNWSSFKVNRSSLLAAFPSSMWYQNKQCRGAWLISTICWGSVFAIIVLWKAGTRMSLCSILFQKSGMKCTANKCHHNSTWRYTGSNHQYLPKSCFHWDELNVYLRTYFGIEKSSCTEFYYQWYLTRVDGKYCGWMSIFRWLILPYLPYLTKL